MAELDPLLVLARDVASEARALGIDLALIGALAMAHHGYVRATVDVDFATATSFDRDDAARLLSETSEANVEETRRVCRAAGLEEELEAMMRSAQAR